MADESFNPLVWLSDTIADALDWIHDTLSDPAISREMRRDLGIDDSKDTSGELPTGDAARLRHPNGEPVDVDKEAFAATVEEIRSAFALIREFCKSAGLDGQTVLDMALLLGQLGAAESVRARSPLIYAIAKQAGFVSVLGSGEDVETLDVFQAMDVFAGGSNVPSDTTEPTVAEGIRNFLGIALAAVVVFKRGLLPGRASASFGYDPSPGSPTPGSDALARAAFTMAIQEKDIATTGLTGTGTLTVIYLPSSKTRRTQVFLAGGVGVDYTRGRLVLELRAPAATAVRWTKPWDWDGSLGNEMVATATFGGDGAQAIEFGPLDGPHFIVRSIQLRLEVSESPSIKLSLNGVDLSLALQDGDEFVQSFSNDLKTGFDVALVYDKSGFRFDGGPGRSAGAGQQSTPRSSTRSIARRSAPRATPVDNTAESISATPGGLGVVIPVNNTRFGPFRFLHAQVAVGHPSGSEAAALELTTSANVELGPFVMTIDGIGMRVNVGAGGPDANFGILDVHPGFKPPAGIGFLVDAKGLRGGGFLKFDVERGEYSGVLELVIGNFAVKAIGILNTKAPDPARWSLLLLLFAEFRDTPWQIGFGFNITGIGGIIGLQHRVSVDELRAALGTSTYDDVLFPADPVKNAPRIIGRLRTLFPVEAAALLVGPTIEINWGTPPLVTARLAILAQFGGVFGGGEFRFTHLTVLGTVNATAPPRTLDSPRLVQLTADLLGDYDVEAGLVAIDARLRDSQLGGVEFSGSLILRVGMGDTPAFAIAAGGFHPAFTDLPPRLPARIDRLALSWNVGDSIELTLQAYAAITASSWQLGAKFTLRAEIGPVDIDGGLFFDAIAYDDGRFSAAIGGYVKIRWRGHTLMKVEIIMVLDRNREQQWHAAGSASFSVLWWDKEVDFEHTWGDEQTLDAIEPAQAAKEVRAALADRNNWSALLPRRGDALVTLADVVSTAVPAHPHGTLAVTQRVAPLGLELDQLDGRPVPPGTVVAITGVTMGASTAAEFDAKTELFPRARFQNLDETELLTHRSFEALPAGVELAAPAAANPDGIVDNFTFETILIPAPGAARKPAPKLKGDSVWHVKRSRAATCALRQQRRLGAFDPTRRVLLSQPTVSVVEDRNLTSVVPLSDVESRAPTLARQRASARNTLVVETHEIGV